MLGTCIMHDYTPAKGIFSEYTVISLSVRLSVFLYIRVSVCVQNNIFCQSAGECIKSHLATALVLDKYRLLTKATQALYTEMYYFIKP